ncbi:hypothetical protein KUTeg_012756 [Tegillarca granosa]|uniref:Uncharacterized protein n=1 Tax=Tegillarca granosa TaxID=220873 RepID=A0ABQ9F2W1_TEGGR|nr:hypothetical protein KUTeg_012756 [Tegillarca granosa]
MLITPHWEIVMAVVADKQNKSLSDFVKKILCLFQGRHIVAKVGNSENFINGSQSGSILIHYSLFCLHDPCVSNAVTLLQKENRAENCPDVQFSNCDAYISPGWYRTDTPMLNYCPTNALGLSCGTTFPAWMNGSDPSEIDGAVVREVCLKGPTTSCQSTYSIQVKNCTSFMAYCLRPLNSCPERYCFGTFGICLSTSSSTATTTTTANSHLHNTGNRDAGQLEPGLTPHRNSTNEGQTT